MRFIRIALIFAMFLLAPLSAYAAPDDRQDRREERGRSDERHDRQDCRQEEGAGKDKRECKQEEVRDGVRGERGDDDDDKDDPEGAAD